MSEQIILRSRIRAREVRAALDYVYNEWGEPSPLCVIDVTNNFACEYQKCHFSPEKVYDNRKAANGIMIPFIFQSDSYIRSTESNENYCGKPLILINNTKLYRVSPVSYASVIVHELSHCRDYVKLLPQIQERYGFDLRNAVNNECNNCI